LFYELFFVKVKVNLSLFAIKAYRESGGRASQITISPLA
jgi:hypothetical protein